MTSVPAKSEQAEHEILRHEVYPVLRCKRCSGTGFIHPPDAYFEKEICGNCHGVGTRVDLSSGVKVELDIECADIFFDDRDRWVAVPSTEETTDG